MAKRSSDTTIASIEVKKDNNRKSRSKRTVKRTASSKAWDFPQMSLEEAIYVARAISDFNALRPMKADQLARVFGYSASSPSFQKRLRSANQYGIVSGLGVNAEVSLTQIGLDIVAPTSPDQRQSALLKAFSTVDLFRRVVEQYGGKRLPEYEFFVNTLVRDFEVPREGVDTFIKVYTENLEYLKAFSADDSGQRLLAAMTPQQVSVEGEPTFTTAVAESENVREFLDTCFILMPFGEWFDKYFKEIYAPATKDAGFEPLRADELFTTGAVMEQIWIQIRKSNVLLADLTGRNPNVYYELGLAHALRKPVVFVAASIDDVPFDVRHLRVVVYDIREPQWAERLRREITIYLKNTRTEPEKSIPQPYRDNPLEESTEEEPVRTRRRKLPS